jgi:ABC-type nitrate/sulfonate/bicarbonate transport system ATPase subunit
MMKLDKISFSFKGTEKILDQFSCEIKKGEFVGIYGPSGAGKSTLAKIIAGHLKPETGSVYLNGVDVAGIANKSRILIHQDSDLFPWFKTTEQLMISGAVNNDVYNEVLDLVELTNIGDCYPFELSVGMRKRLALARALLAKPEVIILDETLSSLQFSLRKELAKNLKKVWASSGITFILITHQRDELRDLTTQDIEIPFRSN